MIICGEKMITSGKSPQKTISICAPLWQFSKTLSAFQKIPQIPQTR
jgi:hypothetical protein